MGPQGSHGRVLFWTPRKAREGVASPKQLVSTTQLALRRPSVYITVSFQRGSLLNPPLPENKNKTEGSLKKTHTGQEASPAVPRSRPI